MVRNNFNLFRFIGNTPIVKINNMNSKSSSEIYAKLESFNPTGSMKDRVAIKLIEGAEKSGHLRKGMTIVESSSGNMGISLSMVGAIKGYPVLIIMHNDASVERIKIIESYGSKVIITSSVDESILLARKISNKNPKKYFYTNQYEAKSNILAHHATAREIINDVPGVDLFIAGIGTCGTLMGVSQYFKEKKVNVHVLGVQPKLGNLVLGIKNLNDSLIPKIYDSNLVDGLLEVSKKDAFRTARFLARKEGLFIGPSSGAVMFAALEEAKKNRYKQIVVLFPDGGSKYLSTDLFGQSLIILLTSKFLRRIKFFFIKGFKKYFMFIK